MAPGTLCLKDLGRVALLETPSGFALFHVQDRVFDEPKNLWAWFTEGKIAQHVLRLLEYRKDYDKSVARCGDVGPGGSLAKLINKYCKEEKELIVEDKKLKAVIELNLGVNCFYEEYVIGELMWGLKNVLYDFVFQERDNITCQYLPLCEGLKDCIHKFGINISAEAIDGPFIASAGDLHRCDLMLEMRVKEMRYACDQLVPEIGRLIEDNKLYAEVMAKILTPEMESGWDFSERFPDEVALKLKMADAAAEDAREKVDVSLFQFLCCSLADLRRLPGLKAVLLEIVKSLADTCSWRQKLQTAEKRSHQLAEGRGQFEEDCVDVHGEGRKKARTDS